MYSDYDCFMYYFYSNLNEKVKEHGVLSIWYHNVASQANTKLAYILLQLAILSIPWSRYKHL